MARQRITAAVRGLAVLAVIGGLSVTVPLVVHAQDEPAPAADAGTAAADRVVTLPTGERVFLAAGAGGRQVRGVAPNAALASSATTSRVQTMAANGHLYVVPDEAMPYLGRQLDLSLFDVLGTANPLNFEWDAIPAAHQIPGVEVEPVAGGRSTGKVTDPTAFGAALAKSAADARDVAAKSGAAGAQAAALSEGVLAGIKSISMTAAGTAPPTATPQYPLTTLTVKGLDTNGNAAFAGSVSATNAEDVQRYSSLQSLVDGQVSFSVPVGHYSLEISITTFDEAGQYVGDALMFFPETDIVAPETEVTADARTAKTVVPVPATPNPSGLEQLQATYSRVSAAGYDSTTAYMLVGGSPELSVTPTKPVSIGEVHWYTYFRLNSPATAAEPYLYDLVFPSDDGVPAKFPTQVPAGGLATVDATYAAEAGPVTINTSRASFQYWENFPIRFASAAVAPLQRTEYISALPDVGWIATAVSRPDEYNGAAQAPMVTYQPGQHVADRYLAAPAVPGVDRGTVRESACGACRQGDKLLLNLQPWTDAGDHAVRMATSGTAAVSTQAKLSADGVAVAESTDPAGEIAIPADAAQLKLELNTTVASAWATTASKVDTAWTWHTATPTGKLPAGRTCAAADTPCAFQPLLFAAYEVGGLDTTNAVKAGTTTPLTVTVEHQTYDPAPAADHLTLEVSGDDGATWTAVGTTAAGDGRFAASVTPAAGSGFLSLRIHATDPQGAILDQTVTRAVRVSG
jgi:hypothetical protein